MATTSHSRTMTRRPARPMASLALGFTLGLAIAGPGVAQEPAVDVVGCDTLVALRVLTAGATSATDAAAHLSAHPQCRLIPKAGLGAVSQRTMIGGAPFECLAVSGSDACVWVAP